MVQEPCISIIINNYNYGGFLMQAIDSALHQTYHNCEIIVVDDGSTDNSREMILSYGDRIVPILKENKGQASALNAGFAHSHGDIIIFLDADDLLLPHIVQFVAEVFQAHADAAKVMYRMGVIDAAGGYMGIVKPSPHLPIRSGDLRQHVLSFPFDMTWMSTSGNAFASSVLHSIFPIPEEVYGRVGADWYVSHLTPLFGTVVFLSDVGALYRLHGANNYELSTSTLDLDHIRQTITYSYATCAYIKKFAEQLCLPHAPSTADDVLSVSFIAKRFVSLKLEPSRHPIYGDTIWRLFWLGIIATFRRFDVSFTMKLVYLLWFAAMALAPAQFAHWLAVKLSFPMTRQRFNRLLGALHRSDNVNFDVKAP